jgi:hypothetical protein
MVRVGSIPTLGSTAIKQYLTQGVNMDKETYEVTYYITYTVDAESSEEAELIANEDADLSFRGGNKGVDRIVKEYGEDIIIR